jgi:hypothetical protein
MSLGRQLQESWQFPCSEWDRIWKIILISWGCERVAYHFGDGYCESAWSREILSKCVQEKSIMEVSGVERYCESAYGRQVSWKCVQWKDIVKVRAVERCSESACSRKVLRKCSRGVLWKCVRKKGIVKVRALEGYCESECSRKVFWNFLWYRQEADDFHKRLAELHHRVSTESQSSARICTAVRNRTSGPASTLCRVKKAPFLRSQQPVLADSVTL